MDHNFDYEIEILNESKNITDKTKIFSIYCNFYTEMTSLLAFQNNLMLPEYKKYLTQVFKATVDKMESMEMNANYLDFFNYFFSTLVHDESAIKVPNQYRLLTLESYIAKLRPTNNFVNEIPYVNMLDTIDMDFATKARIWLIIKEYFNNFNYNISVLYYRKDEALSYIKKEIVNKIVSSIPEIISRSTGFDSFRNNLQRETYDLMRNKINENEDIFFNFSNPSIDEYYNRLSNDNKDVFWNVTLSRLTGYENDGGKDKSIFEEINYNLKVASVNHLLKKMLFRDLRRR